MEQQIVIACLGRPMELGMLYDCRSDQTVPGVTLWDQEKLRGKRDTKLRESSQYEVTTVDSIEHKAYSLNIEANLKLSFLGGLLNVEGAAKYLNNQRKSAHHSRVVLQYSCKTYFEQLTMDQLATRNIDYPDVFDNGMATHVVTAVEYGADAFFVFDRETSDYEDHRKIEGEFKATVDLFVSKIEADAKVQINEEEKKYSNEFKCTFLGDVALSKSPSSFEEAIQVYRDMPELIKGKGSEGIYGVPKKVYLYPLSKLDSRAAKLVRMISANAVAEVQELMEEFQTIRMEATDAENSSSCYHFFGLRQQVRKFRSLLQQFQSEFQQMLAEILPQIRGGGAEEALLLGKLRKVKRSPYDVDKLRSWLDVKKREVATLQTLLETIRATETVMTAFQPGDLQKYTQNSQLKYIMCLTFGAITSTDDQFTTTMGQFSMNGPDSTMENWEHADESWCDDEDLTANLQQQLRLLCDFAVANKEKTDLKCVTVSAAAKKAQAELSGTIFLYVKGRKELFQLCSAPGEPRCKLVDTFDITIEWEAPDIGIESVLYYNVLFRKINSSNLQENLKKDAKKKIEKEWTLLKTSDLATEYLVNDLEPATEYIFKISAVTKCGIQSSEVSAPVKTRNFLSPGKPRAEEIGINDIRLIWKAPNISDRSLANILYYKVMWCYNQPTVLSDAISTTTKEKVAIEGTKGKDDDEIQKKDINKEKIESIGIEWSTEFTPDAETKYHVTNLKAGMKYSFKVAAIAKSESETSVISVIATRGYSMAAKILPDCQLILKGDEDGEPSWYKVPVQEVFHDEINHIRKVEVGHKNKMAPNKTKTILLVGAVGTGKSNSEASHVLKRAKGAVYIACVAAGRNP